MAKLFCTCPLYIYIALYKYFTDVSLCYNNVEAKINGKLLLTSMSKLVEKLELSLGFEMQLKEKVEQVYM